LAVKAMDAYLSGRPIRIDDTLPVFGRVRLLSSA
jgi:hypothetical protein